MSDFKTINNIPENAIRYEMRKLKKRKDGITKMVYPGYSETGYAKVLTDELITFAKKNPKAKEEDYSKPFWEWQEKAKPKIGYPFLIDGGHTTDWLRTSTVKSYYVCGDSNDCPDKLILPKGFPIEDISEMPEMKEGDILMATRNSIYLLTAGR